jgi:hypothetical protein
MRIDICFTGVDGTCKLSIYLASWFLFEKYTQVMDYPCARERSFSCPCCIPSALRVGRDIAKESEALWFSH